MTDRDKPDDSSLEAALRRAGAGSALPEGLMARVLADAARVQVTPVVRPARSRLRRRSLPRIFGRWAGFGGLVTAGLAGFWIGLSPPAALPDAGALLLGMTSETGLDVTAAESGFGWDIELAGL